LFIQIYILSPGNQTQVFCTGVINETNDVQLAQGAFYEMLRLQEDCVFTVNSHTVHGSFYHFRGQIGQCSLFSKEVIAVC